MVESSTGEKKRVRVVDQWQPPNLDKKISIEIAVPEDEQLTLDYLINDSRVSEPLLTCSQINEEEAPILLKELNDRSVGSGLSLLMFDGDQLIGIRLTSVHEKPKKLDNYKFELLPDYKEVIDTKAQSSRAQQRLQTFIEMIGDISPNFIPEDCGPEYFDMEMVGIKKRISWRQSIDASLSRNV
ncbi:hypothetical protein M3Y94_00842500 [Aphelenchoides besseyi]|nr:hypothetical protein M3Y94_00842500 [Aphelenchoides besseyi]